MARAGAGHPGVRGRAGTHLVDLAAVARRARISFRTRAASASTAVDLARGGGHAGTPAHDRLARRSCDRADGEVGRRRVERAALASFPRLLEGPAGAT